MKKPTPPLNYSISGILISLVAFLPLFIIAFHAIQTIKIADMAMMLCWAGVVIVLSSMIGYRFGKVIRDNHALRQTNEQKDSFFSILGHDLRSPMSVVSGFLEILQSNYDKYEDQVRKEYIRHSYVASKRVCDLLEDILEWSRLQRGKMPWQPEQCDLFGLIDETVFLLEANAQKKEIAVQVNVPMTSVVFADPHMLKTVVRNLVSNAIKFTEPGGKITVSSSSANDYEEITVADTGVGISPEHLQKLFKIDVVFSMPGTAKEPGTGLGLVLCKEFVEKNGGVLRVDSEVGQGSRFRFTVPKADRSRQHAQEITASKREEISSYLATTSAEYDL
ncbi:response regulator receiver sensor signal transduction histidine kinase [Candidatus Moduliflexus flocculans]|uniref:histidine kinase n=1 Tax=Candidatus Moduliflexus flocculans TaxID=1499966 RepID=A0A0S6VR76_9BACT|nr:response regulator receiver sensor signal transduction histidine kinase [Candidatus Moduliflexus flocculans]